MAATQTSTTTAAAVADPAPLGLIGFATTTLVLSAANSGIDSSLSAGAALGLALAFGGLAQLLAGMWEFKNGNTFGGVAFSSYGAFWISFWVLNVVGKSGFGANDDLAWYLLAWTVVTGLYLIGTFRLNYGLVAVFGLLFLTFLLLCIGAFGGADKIKPGSGAWGIGGWVGIITAVAAYYMALAGILKAVSKGSINLPVGPIGG
jgi:succinate-acetate transporter protein